MVREMPMFYNSAEDFLKSSLALVNKKLVSTDSILEVINSLRKSMYT
jgi:hypothetical protein